MNSFHQTLGQAIDTQKDTLAKLIMAEQWARHPQFQHRYREHGQAKGIQDVQYTLAYLSEAIASNSPSLFAAYIDWIKVLFEGLKISFHYLTECLDITRIVLQQHFPEASPHINKFIDIGLTHLAETQKPIPTFLPEAHPLSPLAHNYFNALRQGERAVANRLILDAVAQGVTIKDIYIYVFQAGLHEVGRLWQMNQISVAQEHYYTAATQLIMSQLYTHIFSTKRNGHSLVATGVGGELHEIGLRMVADFFEMEGWDTYYLGSNIPAASVVQTLAERQADILAISVTMTFHVKLVMELIAKIRAVDPNKRVKILVGGYPFNIESELWQQVGADGYATNAEQAITVANTLITL